MQPTYHTTHKRKVRQEKERQKRLKETEETGVRDISWRIYQEEKGIESLWGRTGK
jgi:hypothetical protein